MLNGAQTNAYDKAVKGVDGVIHLASPVDLTNTGHPSLIIEPAVKGVTNLLTSLENNDPEARRVVLARCVRTPKVRDRCSPSARLPLFRSVALAQRYTQRKVGTRAL